MSALTEGLEQKQLIPRFFVLHRVPTYSGDGSRYLPLNYELTVYEINETLPDPATATISFLKVVNGKFSEKNLLVTNNEVSMSIGVARQHWKRNIDNGWGTLPKRIWPKWLKDVVNVATGEMVD